MHVAHRPAEHRRSRLGAVYTPAFLADWVAELLLDALPAEHDEPVVLDPACGEGSLLCAVERRREGAVRLVGYDVDPVAVEKTAIALPDAEGHTLDALMDPWPTVPGRLSGVIVNPPWGAEIDHPRRALRDAGYALAAGQFDSYELFLERILRELPDGGVVAAILPDSLFLPEHARLRRLLVDRSTLLTIARLGEGLFGDVYRGTVVLLLRRGAAPAGHRIDCHRLRKRDRQTVLRGGQRLSRLLDGRANRVPQSSFATAPEARFDIDVRHADRAVLDKLDARRGDWDRWFAFGRGVELGKGGRVVACACGVSRPAPRTSRAVCRSCGAVVLADPSRTRTIIRPREDAPTDGRWHPVVVGEDVDRYDLRVRRAIARDVAGIDYKAPETYAGDKLLVRKTGVGIKATIDRTGVWTTQVVYHLRPKPAAPGFALAYALGVLASRCLLAYHLAVTGETEWRSHPYVTPKLLRTLPLPTPAPSDAAGWQQAERVAAAVDHLIDEGYSLERDLEVERAVVALYGLDADDTAWVVETLQRTDDLEALASLRLPDGVDLAPSAAPSLGDGG